VLVFFGASFTIMSFNNDIGITELFGRFYYQVMGTESSGMTELEVSYCIGISIGIIVFFNHFGRKKITPDPTPIQVEMRKYEQDVDTTFIENAGRGGSEIDVN
jgi:stage V sporulation protein AA